MAFRSLARLLAAGLALACLAACGPTMPPAPPPPPPARKPAGPPPQLQWRGARGTTEVPLPDGRPLFAFEGQVIGAFTPGSRTATVSVLDGQGRSLLPEYDMRCVAGRIACGSGDDEIRFEHRLQVQSPTRGVTLDAESGTFSRGRLEFALPGTARLSDSRVRVDGEQTAARLDLRQVTTARLRATCDADSRGWTAQAARCTATAAKQRLLIEFETITGTARQSDGPVEFASPHGRWDGAREELTLTGGVTLTRGELSLKADGAVWRKRDRRLLTTGTTRCERAGLTLTGTGGQGDLSAKSARLANLKGQLGPAQLEAGRGEVDAQRQVTLTGRAKLSRDGFALAAPKIVWRPDSGAVASGGVTLTAPDAQATGATLKADTELSRATLTPVRAAGHGERGQWTLNAPSGTWMRGSGLKLTSPHGSFAGGGRHAQVRSGAARYDQHARRVYFSGGFHAESPDDDLVVDSRDAVYDEVSGRFTVTNSVHAVIRGLTVRNRSWQYNLSHGPDEALGGTAGSPALNKDSGQSPRN